MPPEPGLTTRITLLARLKDTRDEDAWRQFVDRYGPAVYGWCRRGGLQDADAADVTQQVLLRVCRAMAKFRYDPAKGTFRGWLFTVTRHAWEGWLRGQAKHAGSGDTGVLTRLHNAEAREELLGRIGEAYDLELLEVARERVRAEFTPKSWEAFELIKVQGLSGKDAADRLGVSPDAAFQACSRVMRRLAEVVRSLDTGG